MDNLKLTRREIGEVMRAVFLIPATIVAIAVASRLLVNLAQWILSL